MTATDPTSDFEFLSESASHTQRMASTLATLLEPGDVIALEGELGAGKTCFVRGLASGLGIESGAVSSPTFVIMHEYEGGRVPLIHVDAYRMRDVDELEGFGFGELLRAGDSIIAVEWADRIASALPTERISVRIRHAHEDARRVQVRAPRRMTERLGQMAAAHTIGSAEGIADDTCRKCGARISPSVKTFPFCSERCRMADLGGWFSEAYRMTRPAQADDELSD